MAAHPSPGGSAIPLSIEPVIGWRLWCLRRYGEDGAILTSPIRPYLWRPRMPNHAGCAHHVGKQVPTVGCTCGMYAISSLDRLPRAFGAGLSTSVGVVGSVAMWGRVVEHDFGHRGQLAYPDRIRLICRRCFFLGGDGVPSRIELGPSGLLMPVCGAHATLGEAAGVMAPRALERILRSTYAVDLLPVEALHEAGFASGPPPPPVTTAATGRAVSPTTFLATAKAEVRELTRTISGVLGMALLLLAGLALNVVGPFPTAGSGEVSPEPRPSAVQIAVEGPFADDVVARPPQVLVHPPAEPRPRRIGVVCGHRVGAAVRLMACGRAHAELIGFFGSPPDPRSECDLGTGYTRKPSVSVCWFDTAEDPGSPLDRLRLPGVHLRDLVNRWSG
jgi:hypothetical protein